MHLYLLAALTLVAILAWVTNTRLSPPGTIRTMVNVVLELIVVGTLLWLVNSYVPMAGSIKAILNIAVVGRHLSGGLKAFGLWNGVVRLWGNLTSHRLPRTQQFHFSGCSRVVAPSAYIQSAREIGGDGSASLAKGQMSKARVVPGHHF